MVFNSAVTLPTSSGFGAKVTSLADFGGRFFDLLGEAVALLEGDHLQGVDGGEELVELVGELRVVLEVHAAGEHGVDGEVEVLARGVEAVGVVVGDAGLIAGLGLGDEGLHLLCVLCGLDDFGGLLCLLLRLAAGLLLQRGRGGVCRCTARRGSVASAVTAGDREQKQRRADGSESATRGREAGGGGSFQVHHQPTHCKGWTGPWVLCGVA